MNKHLSDKIRYTSFFCIVCVVWIHAYNYYDFYLSPSTLLPRSASIFAVFEFFISNAVTRFAVPMMYLISGYLVFIKFDGTLTSYISLLKKRFRSLFIPYLLWEFFYIIIFIIFYSCGCKESIVVDSVMSLKESLGIGIIKSPIAFQFWYVRDLILMVALSPIVYWINTNLKGIPLIFIGIFWCFKNCYILNACLFFSVGAFLAINTILMDKIESLFAKKYTIQIGILYFAVCGFYTYISCFSYVMPTTGWFRTLIYSIMQIVGVIFIWTLAGKMKAIEKGTLPESILKKSFCIFALHEPMQHIIFETVIYNNNELLSHMILFTLVPCIIIVMIIAISGFMERKIPKFYYLFTGRR